MHLQANEQCPWGFDVVWLPHDYFVLFKFVGSNQILSFRLPDLSLPSTSTKLLIQGVASQMVFSTPACSILSISCLKIFVGGQDFGDKGFALVLH